MARRTRLLPSASVNGEPVLTVAENWLQIEKEYGHNLSQDVRQKILQASTSFVYFEEFERTASSVNEAAAYVSSIKSAANTLQKKLLGSSNSSSDARTYARSIITQKFDDPRLIQSNNNLFDALHGVLTSLEVACMQALKEMENPNAAAHREGECWQNWIRSLTKITSKNGLPYRVSKGSDKSDNRSPFVRLITALHKCVSKEARRHHHSAQALAKAISDARAPRKTGRIETKVTPKKSRLK